MKQGENNSHTELLESKNRPRIHNWKVWRTDSDDHWLPVDVSPAQKTEISGISIQDFFNSGLWCETDRNLDTGSIWLPTRLPHQTRNPHQHRFLHNQQRRLRSCKRRVPIRLRTVGLSHNPIYGKLQQTKTGIETDLSLGSEIRAGKLPGLGFSRHPNFQNLAGGCRPVRGV